MKFNVSQLLKERVGATRAFDVEEEIADLGEPIGSIRLSGDVRLTRTNRSIVVNIVLSGLASGECSRCLEEARFPLVIEFAEEYFPAVDVLTGAPLSVPADGFSTDHNHLLDLTPAAREYALTALPMAPLCRPDCAGICAQCGVDRNREVCNCDRSGLEPRLAALAHWMEGRQSQPGGA